MGLDLNTALISDTFDGLIKTTDGNVLTSSPLVITDGRGNDSSLALATAGNGVAITGTLTVGGVNIGSGLSTAQADITAIEAKTDFITVTGAVNLDTINTKAGFITVTQAVDLDTIESKLDFITVTGAVNLDTVASNASAAKTKTDFLTVTQAVDLDTLESDMVIAKADITAIEAKTDYITISSALNLNTVASNASSAKAKTDFITITQSVNLDTVESGLAQAQTDINQIEAKTNNITVTQAVNLDTMESDIAVNNAKNSYPAGDATKVGFISVTQAVDLDSMETDITNLSANKYDKTGGTISGSVVVTGDLTVNGTTTTVNTQTLSVKDPLIELANDNAANTVDTGFYANYSLDAGVTTKYAGLFKDASDSDKFKLFKGLEVEPTSSVNTAGTGYAKGDLVIGDLNADSGSISGTLSATTLGGTLSTAAQPNITSVGTLTGLAVNGGTDNILASFTSTDTAARIEFADDTTSGQVSIGAQGSDFVAFTNSTERLRITSSGLLGLGTSTPDTLLHLANNLEPELKFEATDTSILAGESLGTISWYANDASAGGVGERAFISSTAENAGTQYSLIFGTGSSVDATEKMRLNDLGYLGIGEPNPIRTIHITNSVPAIRLEDSDVAGLYHEILSTAAGEFQFNADKDNVQASSSFTFAVDGSEKMRIDSSGNVGIGTSSPAATTEISKGSEGLYLKVGGDNASNGRALEFTSSTSTGGSNGALHTINARSISGEIALATGGTEKMRITSAGNVGIGTSSPTAKLEVNVGLNSLKISGRDTFVDSTEDSANANIYVTQTGVGDFSQEAGHLVLQARTQGSVYRDIIFAGGLSNGEALMTINGQGNVGIGTSNPNVKLHLIETSAASAIFLDSTATTDQQNRIASLRSSGGAYSSLLIDANTHIFRTGTTERMRIDSSGDVTINGGDLLVDNGRIRSFETVQSIAAATWVKAFTIPDGTAWRVWCGYVRTDPDASAFAYFNVFKGASSTSTANADTPVNVDDGSYFVRLRLNGNDVEFQRSSSLGGGLRQTAVTAIRLY